MTPRDDAAARPAKPLGELAIGGCAELRILRRVMDLGSKSSLRIT